MKIIYPKITDKIEEFLKKYNKEDIDYGFVFKNEKILDDLKFNNLLFKESLSYYTYKKETFPFYLLYYMKNLKILNIIKISSYYEKDIKIKTFDELIEKINE